jgi:hypothetical protein
VGVSFITSTSPDEEEEKVPETSDSDSILTRLIAREEVFVSDDTIFI